MARYTITPWRTHSDLLTARTQLYHQPSSETAQRAAISRIQAWKLRASNLPHAVESTALLIDSLLHHNHHHHPTSTSTSSTSSFAIRAVYSAAFTRFVTGFCDIGRARSGRLAGPEHQASMLEIARQIGMPAEFVALRHEATHEELPSVARLRGAVERALGWLWEVYWSRLVEVEEEVVDEGWREEVRRTLKHYRSVTRSAFKRNRARSEEHMLEVRGISETIAGLCAGRQVCLKALADILVLERFMFPSSRKLGDSMRGAFNLWDGLLRNLLQLLPTNFLSALIDSLLSQLTSAPYTTTAELEESTEAESQYIWLLHLADGDLRPGSDLSVQNTRADVLKCCCLHPGYWTERIGQALLDKGDKHFRSEWADLFEASKLQEGSDEPGTVDEALDDLDPLDDVSADHIMMDHHSSSDGLVRAEEVRQGWRRALLPPSVPIGVVA